MNQTWIGYLPQVLRDWLDGRQQLQKTIGNTGWLLFDRVLRMVVGITVGAWVARYLGPAQFGELGYVLAVIAFFQVIARLEADSFIVRDIAQNRGDASVILGTALWLRLVSALFSWLLAVLFMALLHPKDHQLILLTAIVGATLLFQASDTVDVWFQSQSQSRRTVIAKLVAYLFSNSVKVVLLLCHAPLWSFAAVMSLECAVLALGLACAYHRFPTESRWRSSLEQAKSLLAMCWPFLLSTLMVTTYLKIDQIMLKEILGESDAGMYLAALQVSCLWAVIPNTLVTSLAPFVAQKLKQDEDAYQEALVKIFRFFGAVALIGSTATALASPVIIRLLYGSQYQPAALILSLHVFVNIFVFQSMAQSLWLVTRNMRAVLLVSTTLSALVNVVANLVMIRSFGIRGAVYSILLTECVAAIVPCLLRKELFHLYKRAFLFDGAARKV